MVTASTTAYTLERPAQRAILIVVLAVIVAALDYVGLVSFPVAVLGASAFYVGAAFNTAFAVWFGAPALLAIYLGNVLGALVLGTFTPEVLLTSLANPIGALIPLLAFRLTGSDPALRNTRAFVIYLPSIIGQAIVSGIWYFGCLTLVGGFALQALGPAVTSWSVGDIVVSIVIGIPLMWLATPLVFRRFRPAWA